MSVAAAIIISTLLLITAWQLEKRGAWARLGKVAGVLLGVFLAAIAGLAGWIWWENGSEAREAREILQSLGNGDSAKYAGLSTGLDDKEVIYLKGEPTQTVYSRNSLQSRPIWVFSGTDDARGDILIDWGIDLRVERITCIGENSFDCPSVGGISIGTSEAEVLKTFGEPFIPARIGDSEVRKLCFGRPEGWVRFLLGKGVVQQITIGAGDCNAGGFRPGSNGARRLVDAKQGALRDYWLLSLVSCPTDS